MRLRWAAAGTLAAEAEYHRVCGHRQLDKLAPALSPATQCRRELADARAECHTVEFHDHRGPSPEFRADRDKLNVAFCAKMAMAVSHPLR